MAVELRLPDIGEGLTEAEIVRFRTEELLRRHQIELDVPPTLLDVLLRSFGDLRAAADAAGSVPSKALLPSVARRTVKAVAVPSTETNLARAVR